MKVIDRKSLKATIGIGSQMQAPRAGDSRGGSPLGGRGLGLGHAKGAASVRTSGARRSPGRRP